MTSFGLYSRDRAAGLGRRHQGQTAGLADGHGRPGVDLEQDPFHDHHVGLQIGEQVPEIDPEAAQSLTDGPIGRGGQMAVGHRFQAAPLAANGSVAAPGQARIDAKGEHSFDGSRIVRAGWGTGSGPDQLEDGVGDVEVGVDVLHVVVLLEQVDQAQHLLGVGSLSSGTVVSASMVTSAESTEIPTPRWRPCTAGTSLGARS